IQDLERRLGSEILRKGGLRIYTTLDLRIQAAAEEELTRAVQSLRRSGNLRSRVVDGRPVGQGALACVEVRTGRVLAMVGGVGPFKRPEYYNRAHPGHYPWGRPVGSSFKPYVFAAALESGYGPDNSLVSGAETITRGSWHPQNYASGQEHMWTLRNALAYSVNLVAIRLIMDVGVDKAVRYASRIMDIPEWRFDKFRYYSLALGTVNISPLEHASGYAVFANGGLRVKRTFVDRIEDYRGNVLYVHKPEGKQVIKHETAISMISMLGSVVAYGTGTRAQGVGCPAGGKTGTTQDDRDVWWVGFTPDLATAVWIGNDDNSPMHRAAGGRFCAPIWAQFTRRAIDILGCHGRFPQGAGVTGWRQGRHEEKTEEKEYVICEESGGLATEFCPNVKTVKMREKPKPCQIHKRSADEPLSTEDEPAGQSVTVCVQSGLRATANCPNVETRIFPPGEAPGLSCTIHGRNAEPEPPPPTTPPPISSGPSELPTAEPPTPPPKPTVPPAQPPHPSVPSEREE
ncbi:MAG: transglycosylase domain-containing protein, partial [Candidatus Zipacnadales bacterium]